MSDEFIKIATQEINEDISQLQQIISKCQNDEDIFSLADKFQKHTHKIKGLAPMMGKEELGGLSAELDSMLKKIINGSKTNDLYALLDESFTLMEKSMVDSETSLSDLKSRISQISNDLN